MVKDRVESGAGAESEARDETYSGVFLGYTEVTELHGIVLHSRQ